MTTLIGTNPDQIPVNSMLGGMAYQDPDSINVKDFNSSGSSTINTINCTGLLSGLGQIYLHSGEVQKSSGTGLGLGGQANLDGPETLQLYGPTYAVFNLLTASSFGSLFLDNSALNLQAGSGKELYLCANNTPHIRVTTTGDILNLGTGATKLQVGTTAQRPASPQEGMIRKNSTLGVIEGYSAGEWLSLQGGLLNVQVFTSTGASTYTPTPGTRKIVVELVGGGGGGAYRPSTTVGQVVVPSPGNNADGVVVKYNSIVAAGQTGSVAVGFGGGAQATPGSNGNNGQQSSFSIGGNSVSVGGGLGGTYATATSTFPVVKMSSGFTGSPSITGFTVLKNASSGVSSIGVYSPTLFAPYLSNSPKSSVDTAYGVGDMSISSESSSASVGGVGTSGKVIIYEYS